MAQNVVVNIRNAVSDGLTLYNYSQESVKNGVLVFAIEYIYGNNYESLEIHSDGLMR